MVVVVVVVVVDVVVGVVGVVVVAVVVVVDVGVVCVVYTSPSPRDGQDSRVASAAGVEVVVVHDACDVVDDSVAVVCDVYALSVAFVVVVSRISLYM